MFSFAVGFVCLVCLCAADGLIRPVGNFSEMVKATDFKFDMYVPIRHSPDMTLEFIRKGDVTRVEFNPHIIGR